MTYENPFEIVENYDDDIKNGFFIRKWNESKICKGYYLNNKMNYWGIFDSDEINIKGYFSDNILDGYGETYNKEDKITYILLTVKEMVLVFKYIKMKMKNMKGNGKMISMKDLEFIFFLMGINI